MLKIILRKRKRKNQRKPKKMNPWKKLKKRKMINS